MWPGSNLSLPLMAWLPFFKAVVCCYPERIFYFSFWMLKIKNIFSVLLHFYDGKSALWWWWTGTERKKLFIWNNAEKSNSFHRSKITENGEYFWQMRGILYQLTLEMHSWKMAFVPHILLKYSVRSFLAAEIP